MERKVLLTELIDSLSERNRVLGRTDRYVRHALPIDKADGDSTFEMKISNRSLVLPQILQAMVYGGAEVYNCHLKGMPLDEIFTRALHSSDVKGRN